jgi:putative ABC transport system permease protein
VGVRKVLGATVASVVRLFNREVTWLVVVAGVVACPLAWLAADTFLADFPYRIDVGPGYFVAALLLILVLAWATVSAQALRAALSNPVDALRYE